MRQANAQESVEKTESIANKQIPDKFKKEEEAKEKEFRDRYGWEELKTFRKYYQRQTRNNVSVDGIFNKLLN